jgi:general secretion pathway protein D
VDRELVQMEDFRMKHGPAIDLAQNNADTYAKINEQRQQQSYVDMKLAEFSEEYGRLYRMERYAEAAAVAEKARAIAPNSPFVEQMDYQSMMAGRQQTIDGIKKLKELKTWETFRDQERASIMTVNDNNLMVGPGTSTWARITSNRTGIATVGDEQSEMELQIYQALEQPITYTTNGQKPLRAVMEELGRQLQINIHIDDQAIVNDNLVGSVEGVSDIPVELNARYQIKLKSALNTMLGRVGLAYTVRNESLYITSPKGARAEVKWKAYYVGDLTMKRESAPITRPKTGMERYKEAMDIALGRSTGFSATNQAPVFAPIQPVSMRGGLNDQSGMGRVPNNILAQVTDSGYRPGGQGGNFGGYGNNGFGYDRMGSAGGGANFDDLINLITQTIDPDSWGAGGGMGGGGRQQSSSTIPDGSSDSTGEGRATVMEYYQTLTLIIRQTEENHQKIVDLLKQLRKMNDIQINVEVRFITIQDDFYESIGMDFDFSFRNSQGDKYSNLNTTDTTTGTGTTSGTTSTNSSAFNNAVKKGSLIAGLRSGSASSPDFSSDLSVSANQNSFGLSVPTFGNYDPAAGASLGFAILSDIETYFFLSAAQGDSRSNILQAPKVTILNGQSGSVADVIQRPFVSSYVPVVGDFAVAYQPVIDILDLGTEVYITAVVSSDRRYVRIQTAPMFSTLVGTITSFEYNVPGSTSVGSGGTGNNNNTSGNTGMTVQLPIVNSFSVDTVVSVPDGGTILMGGIKRLSEGRKEYGVPMINKIPYLKRLFSNSAVGRETQSMMIMITPHIIIQEEYEETMNTATDTH